MRYLIYICVAISVTLLTISCNTRNTNLSASQTAFYDSILAVQTQVRSDMEARNFEAAHSLLEESFDKLNNSSAPNDSLLKYTRIILAEYKGWALNSKEYQAALNFLDTLQSSFIHKNCKYELLAIRAHINQMAGNNQQAIALIDSFVTLPAPNDPAILIQYSEMAGSVYFYCGHNIKKAIAQLEKAVDTYRQGTPSPYIGRILSRLSAYYREENDYLKSAEANQAAINYYENSNNARENNGLVMAYGEQSNLYLTLGLYDRALKMNRIACNYSAQKDSFGLSDLYRFRSDIFQKTGQSDSTFYYLHKACDVSASLKNFKGVIFNRFSLAKAYLALPDSIQPALSILQELCADSAKIPQWLTLQIKQYMGEALAQTGETARGIQLMEKAVSGYATTGMEEMRSQAIEGLMKAYLRHSMNDRFISNYPYYKSVIDSMQHDNEIRALAAANISFDTQKKEQQNYLLTAQLALKDTRLQAYFFIGLCLVVIGISVGGWQWTRQRSLKLSLLLSKQEQQIAESHLQKQGERLQQLITSRQELNNHNEELLRQLTEIQSVHEKSCDLDRVMESLQPRLLTNDEEEQFRTAFSALYPTVLHRLRTICPRATRSDELLCMLIVLKQTNEEIARTLGISRPSVLQNRYRLRTKLSLTEGSDLDAEIRRLLTETN